MIPPNAKSWIPVPPESHFPIQNLPFGLACTADGECDSVVTRLGDFVISLPALSEAGLIPEADFPILFNMMDLLPEDLSRLRLILYELLREENPVLRDDEALRTQAIWPSETVEMVVPTEIPQFVDFYAGIHHASNVGRMFRPDHPPLLPNYRWLPIAYNGRASSVLPSGVPIIRPDVITKGPNDERPNFGPTNELDFELELGFFIGKGNEMGEPIAMDDAEDHILGFVLVNDWSARDVQRFEYQPLGPFLAKSFATSISPWIVHPDALAPFRVAGPTQDPEPLDHLRMSELGHYNIELEVAIQTPAMTKPQVLARSNSRHLYWTFAQMIVHQTSNGTNMEPGDLYASGTISGPDAGQFGSLLELTWRGTQPITLDETGETRTFLEDGDVVTLRGWAQGDGYRVGFGELINEIVG